MVRPDRHDEPKPFVYSDKDGINLSMIGQKIQTEAPPSIEDLALEPGAKISLKFGSIEQYEHWREAQKANGWDVRTLSSGEIQRHHFAGPQKVQLAFGGKDALQAVGYLALTFFARYFPAEARQRGLVGFKDFLKLDFSKPEDEHKWTPNLVWWDGRDPEQVVSKNPFKFGHTVVVGTSGAMNHAYAYISFFSSLNFGIDLGPIDNASESMVRVFIDPKAEKAPKDIDEMRSNTFSIEVDPEMSDLGEMIRSGSAQTAMSRFFAKIGAWHFDLFIEEIQGEITGWKKNCSTEGGNFSETLVEKYSQRVLNLLSEASSGLREHFSNTGLPKQLITLLDNVVNSDDSMPNGLSAATNAFLELAKKEIANALEEELGAQNPNAERIALLFAGGPGVAVITERIVAPILLNWRR